jgi:hypothetical protein
VVPCVRTVGAAVQGFPAVQSQFDGSAYHLSMLLGEAKAAADSVRIAVDLLAHPNSASAA